MLFKDEYGFLITSEVITFFYLDMKRSLRVYAINAIRARYKRFLSWPYAPYNIN